MDTYRTPEGYLFNLHTCSSAEAKRMWKDSIKGRWDYKCAYCGSEHNLSLDHIVPRSKGGSNHINNVLCACVSCNADKAHEQWLLWYIQQDFFTEERRQAIEDWMNPEDDDVNPSLFVATQPKKMTYGSRRNKAYWPLCSSLLSLWTPTRVRHLPKLANLNNKQPE